MNRRTFLHSVTQAGLAAGLPLSTSMNALCQSAPGVQSETFFGVGGDAVSAYFSDAKMHEALGVTALKKPDVQVIAYNFPSWHRTPFMEEHFGKGWTEWDVLRRARKLFPEHSMPRFPLWGYYDESDPAWAAREIDLAAEYGVDAWMIDWYWHEGTQFYHEQIERGLLMAPNRDKVKFAVMWANHDWKNYYPASGPGNAAVILPQVHTYQDFANVANYCAEHYFSQSNYLRLDGKPVFAIFDAIKIVNQLGKDGLKRSLGILRERAHKLGLPGLHLQASNGYRDYEGELATFGFDSATMYGTFGWTYGSKPRGARLPYGIGCVDGIAMWKKHREILSVPFFPTGSVGWDDSPRFGENAGIAINRSPDQFERVIQAARHFVAESSGQKLIYVGAWNEWTEDHVLLPDTLWGYSYLESLHRAAKL